MLKGCRLPDLDSCGATSYDPRAKDEDLFDGLIQVGREGQLCHLLSPLEHPEAFCAVATRVGPGRKDLLFPCIGSCDVCRRLRASYKDEVQTALEIVCLERSTDRGGDLEGGLAQRNGCKRDAGGRDQAHCLQACLEERDRGESTEKLCTEAVLTYPERRKYPRALGPGFGRRHGRAELLSLDQVAMFLLLRVRHAGRVAAGWASSGLVVAPSRNFDGPLPRDGAVVTFRVLSYQRPHPPADAPRGVSGWGQVGQGGGAPVSHTAVTASNNSVSRNAH